MRGYEAKHGLLCSQLDHLYHVMWVLKEATHLELENS